MEKTKILNQCTYRYDSDKTSHEWLDNKILHSISKLEISTILEVGCGNGNMAIRLYKLGYKVTAIDPEESAIQFAISGESEVTFKPLGIYDDPLNYHLCNYDMVMAIEVLEHLLLPRELPLFANKVLNPNGILLITVPFYGSYIKNLISSILNKWDDHFTVLWDGGHIKFWSLRTLKILLNDGGFEIIYHYTVNRVSKVFNFIWPNNIVIIARKKG